MTKTKQYRILHVISGNYCVLAPLLCREKYVLDFENNTMGWMDILTTISKSQWNFLWENNKLELASHQCLNLVDTIDILSESLLITNFMTKNEFELVAI